MIEEKVALILVLVGLYFADCVVMLRPTQAIAVITLPGLRVPALSNKRPKKARARLGGSVLITFGFTFYPVAGYFPALLNPLKPAVAAFKTAAALPSIDSKIAQRRLDIHRLVAARLLVRSLAPMILMHAFLLFGVVPYHLLYGGSDQLLLSVLAAYLCAAAIIAFSYPLVQILKLRKGAYWSLAAQALICVPLSLNFPRKLALYASSAANAERLMARVPDAARWSVAQDFIAALEFAKNATNEPTEVGSADALADKLRQVSPHD